jgi:hypothetical protein
VTATPRQIGFLFIGSTLLLSACIRGASGTATAVQVYIPQTTAMAAAPLQVGPEDLGRPYDAWFRPIGGQAGAPLFDNDDDHVRETPLHRMEHSLFTVDDSRALAANSSAWGIASAELGASGDDRFACFRAYQISHVREVNDGVAPRDAPAGAAFYLSRIYYGHLYETVFSGSSRRFHAGVRADLLVAAGGIEGWASSQRLRTQVRGMGMVPRDDAAIFARTPEEVQRHYRTSGEPVPIFVEFSSLPNVVVAQPQPLVWVIPRQVSVELSRLEIYEDGGLGSAAWQMGIQCRVNGEAVALESDQVLFEHLRVRDNGRTGGAGPMGGRGYTSYPLDWTGQFQLVEGDSLECDVGGALASGLFRQQRRRIPSARLGYRLGEAPGAVARNFGTGNGRVEYRIFYRIESSASQL